jgi:uncharacterized membrane protein YraQ (UPF0718 family)
MKDRGGIDWSFWIVAALSVGAAAAVLAREGAEIALEILIKDGLLLVEIIPKVLAGTLIGALVRLLLPKETIAGLLGAGSGWRGLAIATAAGVLIPAGPFTVFPLAAGFLLAGADAGAAAAFIAGWLLLGLNRAIVWEVPFFGVEFVGLRMLASVWAPFAIGHAARVLASRFVPPPPDIPEGAG